MRASRNNVHTSAVNTASSAREPRFVASSRSLSSVFSASSSSPDDLLVSELLVDEEVNSSPESPICGFLLFTRRCCELEWCFGDGGGEQDCQQVSNLIIGVRT